MVGTALVAPSHAGPTNSARDARGRRSVVPTPSSSGFAISGMAIFGYVTLLVVASRWGELLLARKVGLQIATPPLNGAFDWRPGRTALPAPRPPE